MAESKLKCYVDVDVVEAVCAATGDCVPQCSHLGTEHSTTASSDAEEVPEDGFLTPGVADSRPTTSAS